MHEQALIKNARLVAMDNKPVEQGLLQILIEDGRIAAIGQNLAASTSMPVIDAEGGIVMPGMIDTHRHVWQSLLRGQLADGSLYDYMSALRYGFAPQFSAADAELGNFAGALDALNAGVTTVVDHSHIIATPDHADALLSGLEAAGIRAVFCYGLSDVADADKPIEAARAFTTRWRHSDAERIRLGRLSSDSGLVRFGIGASEFLFAPMHYTVAEVDLARRLNAHRFSVHVANGPFARGTRYVTRMLRKNLVDERTLFIHGNILTKDDLKHIRDAGAAISATPESEMQMGMGTPVWPLAKELGVHCGFGADIVSGGSGDLFTQMRLALAAGRLAANDKLGLSGVAPKKLALTAEDALRAVTIEGAKVAGLDKEVGSIEVGKKADLIILKVNGISTAPVLDPIKTVVMQASVADVDTVMVQGRILKFKGKLLVGDQQGIASHLQSAAERIVRATTEQTLQDAYAYVGTAFPLDRASAIAARFIARALQVPGLDQLMFNAMLAHSDRMRKKSRVGI
jgi:5-methylthioadenosine/S-adenosylhomocysteine deaminase